MDRKESFKNHGVVIDEKITFRDKIVTKTLFNEHAHRLDLEFEHWQNVLFLAYMCVETLSS